MSAQQTPFRTTHHSTSAEPAGCQPFPPFQLSIATPGEAFTKDTVNAALMEGFGAGRQAVEALIQARFANAYDARIARFMPRLFSLQRAGGTPLGAFGLREASVHALFLERYLDQPIEKAIAGQLGQPVDRNAIVEIGQFAGTGAGAFRTLILRLTERLHQDGHHWVVFTGTTALRNAFTRLGLAPRELGIADPLRLAADERDDWGTYYRHSPRVMFGDIREGFAAISARLATGDAA